MQHFPSSGPATTAATATAPAIPLGVTHPTQGPLGLGHEGTDQSHADPTSSTPKRPLAPALVECGHREPNPPGDGVPLLSGKGWVGKSTPILTGVIPAQEGCQRQIPLLAPLFRQAVGREGEAGSQAHDQVSDWKRWDRSRAAKCSSASEGDRPPSSCNTDCRASATAAGISLAFLEREQDTMEGEQELGGRAAAPVLWESAVTVAKPITEQWDPASSCHRLPGTG